MDKKLNLCIEFVYLCIFFVGFTTHITQKNALDTTCVT